MFNIIPTLNEAMGEVIPIYNVIYASRSLIFNCSTTCSVAVNLARDEADFWCKEGHTTGVSPYSSAWRGF